MLPAFVVENQAPLLFYGVLILLIVLFRHKIEWQTFGIGMYKTKIGLKLMQSWGKKYAGLVQLLGYIGVGVGFIGMVTIMFILGKGFIEMFFDPTAPPVVSPVIPGFSIWGHDLEVPLITGWLALFVVIVIHEFSHGVVSLAHKIKVKSSGLLVFGPIAGAFVEPDEKKLPKQDPVIQYSLFAAGPWSNVLSAGFFVLLAAFVVAPLLVGLTVPGGVEIMTVQDGYPAAEVLLPGMVVIGVNGNNVASYTDMSDALDVVAPGDEVSIATKTGTVSLTAAENPDVPGRGYLGVTLQGKRDPKIDAGWFSMLISALLWFREFLNWVILLSLGIGLANLLPIGPVDGGRMLQTAARQITGDIKRGDWWWKKVSMLTLGLLIVLLAVPILRAVF